MVKIIAAISSNGLIGKNGQLVVKNKLDMQHFKEKTIGDQKLDRPNIIIMGRKTFESMGCKPLPKRKNAVISSTKIDIEGVTTYSNLSEAIGHNSYLHKPAPDVWLIGGQAIYEEGMEYANEIYLTVSKTKVEFTKEDTVARFPVINPMRWTNPEMNVFYTNDQSDKDIALYHYERT